MNLLFQGSIHILMTRNLYHEGILFISVRFGIVLWGCLQ